jgi:hypothetical protein
MPNAQGILRDFECLTDDQLEQWLNTYVYEASPELFEAVLRLWCERVPGLSSSHWDRLHPAVELARRKIERAAADRWAAEAYAAYLEEDYSNYPEQESELRWQDEQIIAQFHGDHEDQGDEDEDNPDWYQLPDPGDYFEWVANQDYSEAELEDDSDIWFGDDEDALPDRAGDTFAPATTPDPPRETAPRGVEPAPAIAPPEAEIRFTKPQMQAGYTFERWVVGRFRRSYFGLVEWRGDKSLGDWRPKTSAYPDLVFDYPAPGGRKTFAVECKWRTPARDGSFSLPSAEQFDRYRRYADRFSMPVFIVIGVGQEPHAPQDVYVVPVSAAFPGRGCRASMEQFRRRDPLEWFWWNRRDQHLS